MTLTTRQRKQLFSVFTLINRQKRPSENTEQRLVERSGLQPKLVGLAVQILYNEGGGWIDFDMPRRSSVRGYYVKPKCGKKTESHLSVLFTEWQAIDHAPVGGMQFEFDPDDPDDHWEEGTYDD